jgi:hypothetical protein
MAGLESLRTPKEVAELRGLSVNHVLGLDGAAAEAESGDGAAEAESGRESEQTDAEPAEEAEVAGS